MTTVAPRACLAGTSARNGSRFFLEKRPPPGYVSLLETGELERRAQEALQELASCTLCPRNCRTDRLQAVAPAQGLDTSIQERRSGRRRSAHAVPSHVPRGTACFTGRHARVSSAFAHFGEEASLRGRHGSGTIFFSFCNLRCVFCQNWDISHAGEGREVTGAELAALMLELQAAGCHNINLVTPEHVVPHFLEALSLAAGAGLRLPIVYNTSAYDSARSLALLDGIVDIYMPDFKCWDTARARGHLKAADYPETARQAIREMHRQVGPLCFDRQGLAARGVLVRHLVMPDALDDSREIFRFLAAEISLDTYVNIMGQYHPAGAVTREKHPELCRRLEAHELAAAHNVAASEGLWRIDGRL